MRSIFQKIRTVFLSSVHGLLDAAIDLNNLGAVEQHVRDLEEATGELGDQAAIANSRVSTLTNDVAILKVKIATTDENITILLTDNDPTNDFQTKPLEVTLMGLEAQLKDKEAELEDGKRVAASLNEASSTLEARLTAMQNQVRKLKSMEQVAEAKQQATAAVEAASEITTGTASIDNVAAKIRDKAVVADARFDKAMGKLGDASSKDATLAEAEARLVRRRQQIEAAKTGK